MKTNPLIGRVINAVYVAVDGSAIRFDMLDGEPIVANAYGDCCSHTWIENVETPENLLGTVSEVEDLDLPPAEEDEEKRFSDNYIQFYGCKISTEKGSSTLDYRNESNGYYGGTLSWPGDYDSFTGDISKVDWKQVA